MTDSLPPPTSLGGAGDEALLLAARRDHEAFALLFDRHAPALAGWLRRRTDADAAQELLAETFAQAWCARRSYRPGDAPVRAWLYGIAQHLLFGYYRRLQVEDRARRRLGIAMEPHATPAYDEADARLDAAALQTDLAVGLARLTPATRDAVVLRIVEQLGYDELAQRLRCSPAAARLRVSRGLRELRRSHVDVPPPSDPVRLTPSRGVLS